MEKVKLGGAVILGNRGNGQLPMVPQAPAQAETASEKLARLQAEIAAVQAQAEKEKAAEIAALETTIAAAAAKLAALKPPAPQPQPAAAAQGARQPNKVYRIGDRQVNQKAYIRHCYLQAGPAGLALQQLSVLLDLPVVSASGRREDRRNYSNALVNAGHLVKLANGNYAHTPDCKPMPS